MLVAFSLCLSLSLALSPCDRFQDILAVMTDRLHKSGFKMHATLLRHMFQLVEAGQVTLELYDPSQHPNVTVGVGGRPLVWPGLVCSGWEEFAVFLDLLEDRTRERAN